MPIFGAEIPFASYCGIVADETLGERTVLRLALRPEHANNIGIAHGGVTSTLLDIAMGTAARRAMGAPSMTIDMQIGFISPGRGVLVAEGRVVRAGRSIVFCEGEVHTEGGDLVAKGTAVFKPARPKPAEAG